MNPKTDKVNGKVITAKEDSIMKNKTQAVEACIGTARLRACRADREKTL
jgi:hypothetical protein